MTRKLGSIEASQTADLGWRCAARAQLAQTGGLRGFRKFIAVEIEDEPVVVVPGLRQAEQGLQKAMDGRRVKKVAPAHNVCDALGCVVDDHRKMVTGGHFFARQNHIAPSRSIDGDGAGFSGWPCSGLNPCQ